MSAHELGKRPSRLPPADLSATFGQPPDRSAGVPRLAPAPASPSPAPSTARDAQAENSPVRSPRARGDARPEARRGGGGSVARGLPARHVGAGAVVVWLDASVRARLREHASTVGRSHTQVVFAALNAVHDRLADVMATAAVAPREPDFDGLFQVQQAGRRVHEEDQVQVSIRPNAFNLSVIDGLAERHTGGNRSALVNAVLSDYLPESEPEPEIDEAGEINQAA